MCLQMSPHMTKSLRSLSLYWKGLNTRCNQWLSQDLKVAQAWWFLQATPTCMNSRLWRRVTSKYRPRPYLECSRFVEFSWHCEERYVQHYSTFTAHIMCYCQVIRCRLHLGRRCMQSGHDCQEPSCSCWPGCGYTTGCSKGLGTSNLYKFSSSEEPSCFSPHCLLYSSHSIFLLQLILTKFQDIIVLVGIYLSLQLRKKSVGYPSLKELLRPVVPLDTSILTPSDSKL